MNDKIPDIGLLTFNFHYFNTSASCYHYTCFEIFAFSNKILSIYRTELRVNPCIASKMKVSSTDLQSQFHSVNYILNLIKQCQQYCHFSNSVCKTSKQSSLEFLQVNI